MSGLTCGVSMKLALVGRYQGTGLAYKEKIFIFTRGIKKSKLT